MKKCMTIAVVMLAALNLMGIRASAIEASKILYNGKIFTSVEAEPFTEALAIKGRFILETGTTEEVLALAGTETQLIDLQGKTVIPGINDAHVHLAPFNSYGIYLNDPAEFVPNPGPSFDEFLAIIAGAHQQVPEGVWFYLVVGETVLDDPEATRFAFDAVAPGRPVIMFGWSGHEMRISTATMEALSISETEADPDGGYYERVADTDIINGVLQGYAVYDLARRLRMTLEPAAAAAEIKAIEAHLLRMGITSIQDMPIGYTAQAYEDILDQADLRVRVRNIAFPITLEESRGLYADAYSPVNPMDKVTTSGIKWVADGTEIERGSALEAPYFDAPDQSGHLHFSTLGLDARVADSFSSPFLRKEQRLFHATGDLTVTELIHSMELVAADHWWKFRRLRIEHGDMIQPKHMPALASKGVMVIQNPTHFAAPGTMFNRFGPERMATLMPLRSLLEAGIPVALGSDALGTPPNPYLDMLFAAIHPTNPAEAISIPEAVTAYTRTAAEAEFMEIWKGTLQPGKLADIAVLSMDIFDPANFEGLPATSSLMTIIDGEIVWDTGALD